MAETLLSIQEAAKISGKSIQTLRRALKAKKIRSQKKKTPQGFNYLVVQDSLMSFYKLKPSMFERDHASIKEEGKTSTQELSTEFATIEEFKKLENSIGHILDEHKKEKENFMRFMKAFQERFVVLENQLKLLNQPQRKWYQFWKKS